MRLETPIRLLCAGLLIAAVNGCRATAPSLPAEAAKPQEPPLDPAVIDRAARAAWADGGVTPAPVADDARFLRRVTLDLVGTIPTAEAVTAFTADHHPVKRERAVDALLASPGYASHWMSVWDDILMGQARTGIGVDREAFRSWLQKRFASNTGWDRTVFDLVSATGRNSAGGPRQEDPVLRDKADDAAGVNGAVNWILRYQDTPQDLSGSVARTFLGVQIQCAQCHDHKTEKWKQTDFRNWTASFVRTRGKPLEPPKKMEIRPFEVRDFPRPVVGGKKAPPDIQAIAASRPSALDGTYLGERGSRKALAAWLTSANNPWFARMSVNRLWARLTGRGFVDPVDDFRPSNPPELPELLDQLATDFASHGFDQKRLLRAMCLSEIYQESTAGSQGDPHNELWSHQRLRPMGPEELLNSLMAATGVEPVMEGLGGADMYVKKERLQKDFSFLFDVDESSDDDGFNGTIPQALMLLNGGLVNQSVRPIPGTTMEAIFALKTDEERIDELYLRTLSREPTPDERAHWLTFVNGADAEAENGMPPRGKGGDLMRQLGQRVRDRTPKKQAYEDLFWALLNSSEFIFNH